MSATNEYGDPDPVAYTALKKREARRARLQVALSKAQADARKLRQENEILRRELTEVRELRAFLQRRIREEARCIHDLPASQCGLRHRVTAGSAHRAGA